MSEFISHPGESMLTYDQGGTMRHEGDIDEIDDGGVEASDSASTIFDTSSLRRHYLGSEAPSSVVYPEGTDQTRPEARRIDVSNMVYGLEMDPDNPLRDWILKTVKREVADQVETIIKSIDECHRDAMREMERRVKDLTLRNSELDDIIRGDLKIINAEINTIKKNVKDNFDNNNRLSSAIKSIQEGLGNYHKIEDAKENVLASSAIEEISRSIDKGKGVVTEEDVDSLKEDLNLIIHDDNLDVTKKIVTALNKPKDSFKPAVSGQVRINMKRAINPAELAMSYSPRLSIVEAKKRFDAGNR